MTDTPSADAPSVRTEEHDGVLLIAIDRPGKRNAVDRATARALAAAFDELDARDDLMAGVLTGAGGVFSAGMDLKAFAAGDSPVIPGRGFAGLTRLALRTPLIAAVEGWALGGGTEMALACDLIVASRDATFGLTEVAFGLVPPEGGIVRLPERIPRNTALEVLLTGDPLPARPGRTVRPGQPPHRAR
jgi:enoyl-CoA hydratase